MLQLIEGNNFLKNNLKRVLHTFSYHAIVMLYQVTQTKKKRRMMTMTNLQTIISFLQNDDRNSEWNDFYNEVLNQQTSQQALAEALQRTLRVGALASKTIIL